MPAACPATRGIRPGYSVGKRYPPIGDYALIGDCHWAALIARDSLVDWFCSGRFGIAEVRPRAATPRHAACNPAAMSKRSLREAVVVVTGASSGIGRATALAFCKRGARVVVAARRQEPLDSLVAECERISGMSALAVPTDVSDETQVKALAQRAVQRFGRIDVWINNAGVYAAGRFEDTPSQVFRQVVEVNFSGYVYGAREALPYLKRQHGVLINNASVDSMATFPYFSAYVASKWAVRGFSASLRQELVSDGVDVCTILPASIDTPLFQHAANYMGRALKALNPTYDPEQVAAAMVRCAENGGPREVIVGLAGRLLALQYTLAPGLSESRRRPCL